MFRYNAGSNDLHDTYTEFPSCDCTPRSCVHPEYGYDLAENVPAPYTHYIKVS